MQVIMCNINMFDADQQAMIFKNAESLDPDEVVMVKLNELKEVLPALCFSNGISNLHLFGPAEYCNGLAKQIATNDKKEYSNMKLEIEVN